MRRVIALSSAALVAAAAMVGLTALPAVAVEECQLQSVETLPYEQVFIDDPNADAGTTYVVTPGTNGFQEILLCWDHETPDDTYTKPGGRAEPTAEVVARGTRVVPSNPPSNGNTGGNNSNNNSPLRPAPTPSPSDSDEPTPSPTPTPTPSLTTPASELELDPTYYDVEPRSGQNLLATGALAGAIIMSCAVILGALFYRRFFRDRLKYRGR